MAEKFAIPKLNGRNWQTWSIRVEALLSREDLCSVVEDAIPAASARSTDWIAQDRKARSTMLLLLEDNQFPIVKGEAHAKNVYDKLKSYHNKKTRSFRVSLLKRLCSTNLTERGDLEQHVLELDELYDRLQEAGMDLAGDVRVCMLLRSLPSSFDHLVAALDLMSDKDLTLDTVKSKLSDEYHRRQERDGGGKLKVEKAMRSAEQKEKVCFQCKKPGHLMRHCRSGKKKSDTPAKKEENGRAKAAHSGDEKAVAFTAGNEGSGWVIDSGASAHMTNDRSMFTSLREFAGGWITLADGKKTQILGEGSVVLFGLDGDEKVIKIEVNKVKFVPGLSTNLISVSKLAHNGLKVCFDDVGCRISDPRGKVVATGDRRGGLYFLWLAEASMVVSAGQHTDYCQHLWHRRLGHRDWAAAERIIKEQLATGMKVRDCGIRSVCECCLEGKSARAPFPAVTERKSTQILDIVHTDLCGPMQTSTPSGNRYVMHLIDDFSRYTVTFLLKQKSEATNRIKAYVRWTENRFGRKMQIIRSDGGGEFDNKEVRKFYQDEGIKPQFTTPYSPQQNGVAERKNRSSTEMATCLLIDAGLPKRFWGEAVLTATYLQNRLPSRSISKTPYELWWGKKPDLQHLRVFGSEAFVHIPDSKRTKMDSKAKKLVFVGYSMEHKGYRFVDPETDVITVSRDAKFIELSNRSSQVELPAPEPLAAEQPAAHPPIDDLPAAEPPAAEEEIQLLPKVEKLEEEDPEEVIEEDEMEETVSDFQDAVSEEEAENVPAPTGGAGDSAGGSRPKRAILLPKHLDEYEVGVASCAVEEPENYKEAMKKPEWLKAMQEELVAHQQNGTWELAALPKGRKVVGSKWVFKVKRNERDDIVKFKARLVAQGYTQHQGVDFDEVFAPVTRQSTLRVFLTVATKRKLVVQHWDVKTAYLNGTLEEEIYMRQPPGHLAPGKEELVCRLRRSIYGLRQSARCWNRKLNEVLTKLGFKAAEADPCLYRKQQGGTTVLLLVYVDDLLVGSTRKADIDQIFQCLQREFELTNLGGAKHFLGMEVKHDDGCYKVRVKNQIDKLLYKFGMEQAKTAKSPMDPGYLKAEEPSTTFEDQTKYRSLVGGLMYIACTARPDIAVSAAILGRKFSAPNETDWTAAKRVLRYLKATREYYLRLGSEPEQALVGHSDADWAGDPENRRSTSGFVFTFGGGAISWASRQQSCVTLSSMEAEYVALSEACQEAIWLRQLLRDFGEQQQTPTLMKEDNQGCLAFVKTERASRRSKHIDTRQKFVQELCVTKQISLEYCPTDQMVADLFTKPLGPLKLGQFCGMLGLLE